MRGRRTGRAAAALAAAAAVAMVAAGCGGDGGDEERAQPSLTVPSTSATTATTAPPDPEPERIEAEAPPGEPRPDIDVNVTYPSDFTPEQVAVVDAYRGYWHAYFTAADPVDPDHPLISRYATVERALGVKAGLERFLERGVVAQLRGDGSNTHAILSVEIDGSIAVLRDCSIDDGLLVSAATGAVVDDDVVTRESEFTLTAVDGSWKVSGTEPRLISEQPGVAGCAEQLS